MQYLVSINQTKALEWGLNAQQAMLFAFLHQVPTWADACEIDGATWFNIGKGKVVEELPLLTDKPDTVYRLMKQLRVAGLIWMTSFNNKTYIRLTPKSLEWNRAQGSEENPTSRGKKKGSEKSPSLGKKSGGRKNIREGSEKSPTNQDTKIITPSHSGASEQADSPESPSTHQPNVFERAAGQTDNGEPAREEPTAPRKTAMHLEWEPEPETYRMACMQRGLAPDANVHAALIDFREHFAAQPNRTNTHADWTRRFVRWVFENQQRQQRAATATTGGHAHANRRDRTPKRRLTAQEARAAAEGRAPDEPGRTFEGQWSSVDRC